MEDIQQRFDYNYGEATVSEVTDNEAKANAGSFTNLSAIVKFNFKYNCSYLKDIQRVEISGVTNEATFPLAARNTPTLTLGTKQGITVEPTKVLDNAVYVTLFPGETQPSFKVSTENTVYAGTLTKANLKAGKFYNVTLTLTKTDEKVYHKDYVVVCGVKWARGNLVYDPDYSGDEGFREHWRIAPYQWYFGGYDKTEKFAPYDEASGVKVRDHFHNSWLETDAFDPNKDESSVVAGKLYSHYPSQTNETTSFDLAIRGDLCYYESNGKYRLPDPDEYTLLTEKASYQFGYVVTPNRSKVYGVLFSTPVDSRVTNLTEREISESELRDGLFLPASGVLTGSKSDHLEYDWNYKTLTVPMKNLFINNSLKQGFYFIGATYNYSEGKITGGGVESFPGMSGSYPGNGNVIDTSDKRYYETVRSLATIRPVYCGDE